MTLECSDPLETSTTEAEAFPNLCAHDSDPLPFNEALSCTPSLLVNEDHKESNQQLDIFWWKKHQLLVKHKLKLNPSSRLRLMKVLLGSVEHISATAGVVLEVPSSTNTSGTPSNAF